MTTATDQLRSLSEILRLNYEEQDWGIINADGKRLEEFVAIYAPPRFRGKCVTRCLN